MRKLTLSQKSLIAVEFFKNTNIIELGVDTIRKLEKINDYETLSSDANRFLRDLVSQERYSKDGVTNEFIKNYR